MRAAIVGAGIAGLTAARALTRAGHEVRVFDKARGPGGRTSTRRAGELAFDHGAQYFTVRSRAFGLQVADWRQRGVVRPWEEPIVAIAPDGSYGERGGERRFVGMPRMSALARDLATGLTIETGARIARIERERGGWCLRAETGVDHEGFDLVLVATPAPQAVPLLAAVPALAERAEAVVMEPCWALMLAFAEPLATAFGGAFVSGSPLGWVARNASKPGRGDAECWVLHATPEWSSARQDANPERVARELLSAFGAALGRALPAPRHAVAHRWLYARTAAPLGEPCLWHAQTGLGACGDWLTGARVEEAYRSGAALAEAVVTGAPSSEAARGSLSA